MPVSCWQKAVSLGWCDGRTYVRNSFTLQPLAASTRTIGNSMTSCGSTRCESSQVASKSKTAKQSKVEDVVAAPPGF